ncbi:MAG: cytochrome-c oxidase, cbb3-type subunit I [Pirellulales bacterium]|nr:cytochrome-c oxidase, cbb3-type subunit I [Pirellulales bacterium]
MTPETLAIQAREAPHPGAGGSAPLERFVYNDAIVRAFLLATVLWGVVAFLVGLLVALQLALPVVNLGFSFTSFGRMRPLHTNAAIFAFAGNAVFAAIYHSTQRLAKARLFSDFLGQVHFWGWQAIIVGAAVTLPLGVTTGKEYAELEWPIDIAIALVWVVFAINFFGTLVRRRERHMYVSLWFYIATIITIAVLHIFNSLELPMEAMKSYPVYAGVQDAFMQWWYGHNAVGFMLTTPFLGLMYYYLPKAAERPVYSYRLSIVHFWALVFIYIWAGPHHLHYTALPEWASTLGMLFSIMLWMPSWGGMLNGLLTLRGAWNKVTAEPILKFFVVGVTFYGMSTFEGPLLSVKEVNALAHYTDWIIAHVHAGALGWVGLMTFGMLYWLMPRMFQVPLWSKKLADAHFWIATIGILLYIVPIYVAGLTQGLMWRAIDSTGNLSYPDFVETVLALMPMYWLRLVGGTLYLAGAVLCGVNCLKTMAARPARYEEPVHEAPALARDYVEPPKPRSRLKDAPVLDLAHRLDVWQQGWWHRRWERRPLRFTVWVTIAVIVASLFEIIPLFLIRSNVPTIASVKPYTPLELLGRDVYLSEGCYNCHSQMVRPILAETKRYGEYSKPGESVFDHPFQWGSRRIGPDLAREGGKQSALWHVLHFQDPRQVTQGSVMPAYPWLLERQIDFNVIEPRMAAMQRLGVSYRDDEIRDAAESARRQASVVAANVVADQGPAGLENKEVIALVAYLDRLGKDLFETPPSAESPTASQTAGNEPAGRERPPTQNVKKAETTTAAIGAAAP